jgi:hypothetical protein
LLTVMLLLFAFTTTIVHAAEKSAEDYFVHSLPGVNPQDPFIKMHAG